MEEKQIHFGCNPDKLKKEIHNLCMAMFIIGAMFSAILAIMITQMRLSSPQDQELTEIMQEHNDGVDDEQREQRDQIPEGTKKRH